MDKQESKQLRDRLEEIQEEIADLTAEAIAIERLLGPQGKTYTLEEVMEKLGIDTPIVED